MEHLPIKSIQPKLKIRVLHKQGINIFNTVVLVDFVNYAMV